MATSYGEFVVCGAHKILHPAGARCPDCNDTTPQGVAQSPSMRVEIVPSRGVR